ncbi:DNA-binding proteins Bright/BRCAA1/RBP1 and proteins containing BRIGHT domain [Monascus purpureus]|uniref:DNA-binding proteins Bright/BRCAA1/RBP1 and proteins containing BRIGHT domain n=1 Tax=Monascus purpureus TaxID=5098 RepID=A0A507R7F1_MONPU|nr:DNA-binding proteins Bright/BRCAA1/RBP1 and proteins containing BRIGHT domain [Monascus purpureus]BDD59374.1 hypothetical protein MAP00_004583 [Monascus purpureus]
MAPQTGTSSIAMALAGKTASVDIPKPRAGFVSRRIRRPSHSGQSAMLPTPPNSISPVLSPQAFKQHSANLAMSPNSASMDSDIDLREADGAADGRDQPHQSYHDPDSVGAITPSMLAKYHLPEILLQQGPLAIRNIMGCLTTSVPGFAMIPPAKARRVVVAALEGRGNGAEDAGLGEDVIFEKIGWGRWDARRRGEPLRDRRVVNATPPSSVPSSFQHQGLKIPVNPWQRRDNIGAYGTTSTAGDSAFFSHSEKDYGGLEDISMLEHEADKMSLDGDAPGCCSSSEAPDDVQDEDWDEGDITDEEDWAAIGAAGLRARSLNSGGGLMHTNFGPHAKLQPKLHGGGPATSSLAKSAPRNIPFQQNGFSLPDGVVGDIEERAAIEALLRLGSM